MEDNIFKALIANMALGNFLSAWDTAVSYDDIIDILNDADDWDDPKITRDEPQSDAGPAESTKESLVLVWEPFEHETPSEVADKIQSMYDQIQDVARKFCSPLIDMLDPSLCQDRQRKLTNTKITVAIKEAIKS